MQANELVQGMKAYRDSMRKSVANRKKANLSQNDIERKQSLSSRKKQFKQNGVIMRNDRIQSNIEKVNDLGQKWVEGLGWIN